jgi:hypothetical protein
LNVALALAFATWSSMLFAPRRHADFLDRGFAADANGDGRADLVTFPLQGRGPMLVYRGPLSGARAIPSETIPVRIPPGRNIAAHDFNADGATDFVVAEPYKQRVHVFANGLAKQSSQILYPAFPPGATR